MLNAGIDPMITKMYCWRHVFCLNSGAWGSRELGSQGLGWILPLFNPMGRMHYCPCVDLISVFESVPMSKKVPVDLQSVQTGIIIHLFKTNTVIQTWNSLIQIKIIFEKNPTFSSWRNFYTLRALNPDYCHLRLMGICSGECQVMVVQEIEI